MSLLGEKNWVVEIFYESPYTIIGIDGSKGKLVFLSGLEKKNGFRKRRIG